MASIPKIAIVGAGPAGLTLARLLHVSPYRFDITVYERDESATSRAGQGGTLDLHATTGLAAIRKCKLWDEFSKHARYEGEEMKMLDRNATVIIHRKSANERPEIDRYRLRDILLDSVPTELIRWNSRLLEVTAEGKLRFEGRDSLEGPFDLIVGADGGWSKVRRYLNGAEPYYAGVSGFELEIAEPAKTCPHIDRLAGQGALFGASDRKLLNAQRMGNGSLKVRSWFQCPEGEAEETLKLHGKGGMLDVLLDKYPGWAPEMTELLRQADLETLRPWILYELPVGAKWEHTKGATLIGDAASLSTPFSGQGVNKAMEDALELARMIEKSQDAANDIDLDTAIQQFEFSLFLRSEKLQATTQRNKRAMFESDSPAGLVPRMLETVASESSSPVVKIIATRPVFALLHGVIWVRQCIGWLVRRLWRRN